MSVGRGKSLSGEERCILARNDAEGSAQLLDQSGSFVHRWVTRASRDGSMRRSSNIGVVEDDAIVQHRVKDDFRLDFQWC